MSREKTKIVKIFSQVDIGQQLRDERKRLGLKQTDVQELTGISVPTLIRAEKGEEEVGEPILRLLALTYGLPSDYFLVGKREQKRTIDTMNFLLRFPDSFDATIWERNFVDRKVSHCFKETIESLVAFRESKKEGG